MISDFGYIKSSIERIEKRLDISEFKFDGVFTRQAHVEESVSSAHKRIDEQIIKHRDYCDGILINLARINDECI